MMNLTEADAEHTFLETLASPAAATIVAILRLRITIEACSPLRTILTMPIWDWS